MKLLVLVAIIFVSGTAFLVWRKHPGTVPVVDVLPFVHAHTEMPKPAKPVANTKPAPKFAHFVKGDGTIADPQANPEQPNQAEPAPVPVIVPPRPAAVRTRMPFPVPDKVSVGSDTDAVTGRYGDPSAWAVAAEDGHVVETLVYLRESAGPATVIRIVDGRVAVAYTKIQPTPPQGSLIRNFGLQN